MPLIIKAEDFYLLERYIIVKYFSRGDLGFIKLILKYK